MVRRFQCVSIAQVQIHIPSKQRRVSVQHASNGDDVSGKDFPQHMRRLSSDKKLDGEQISCQKEPLAVDIRSPIPEAQHQLDPHKGCVVQATAVTDLCGACGALRIYGDRPEPLQDEGPLQLEGQRAVGSLEAMRAGPNIRDGRV